MNMYPGDFGFEGPSGTMYCTGPLEKNRLPFIAASGMRLPKLTLPKLQVYFTRGICRRCHFIKTAIMLLLPNIMVQSQRFSNLQRNISPYFII